MSHVNHIRATRLKKDSAVIGRSLVHGIEFKLFDIMGALCGLLSLRYAMTVQRNITLGRWADRCSRELLVKAASDTFAASILTKLFAPVASTSCHV
jgi:hypothetical protein